MRRLKWKGLKIFVWTTLGLGIVAFVLFWLPSLVNKAPEKREYDYNIGGETTISTKKVGDTFNLIEECKITIEVNEDCGHPIFTSSNIHIATINAITGDVECLQVGQVMLYLKIFVKGDPEPIMRGYLLTIISDKQYPQSIDIELDSVTLSDQKPTDTNVLNIGESSEIPEISYLNNLVEYDYLTGIVSIRENVSITENMSDKVTIKIKKNETEYHEIFFDVNIICTAKNLIDLETQTLSVGNTKTIRFDSALQENDLQNSFTNIQILDTSIVQIVQSDLGYVKIKGISKGETKITISNGIKTIQVLVVVE